MPAPYGRRDWQQRADRALGRTGRGNQQGRFLGARPVMNSPVNSPANTTDSRDVGELHYIEGWSITGTSDSTFRTTHEPLPGSWNLELNGVRVHRSEFSVDGRVITITSPTDLFKGVATQGSPWDLEIQYDYRDLTVFEPLLVGTTPKSFAPTPGTVDYPVGVQVGDLMVLTINTGGVDWLGTPAGWTAQKNLPVTIGGVGANRLIVATRYAAGETNVTTTWAGTSGKIYALAAYRNIASPSVIGHTVTGAGGALATGPSVSATGPGLLVHVFAFGMNSGVSITAGAGYTEDINASNIANFVTLVGHESTGAGSSTARTATGGTSSAVWEAVTMFCASL